MKLAYRVLELYVIKVVFEKIREELLDELENTTNDGYVIDMGKYINDLTTLINNLDSILHIADNCIKITRKHYKRYDFNNDRVSNITDNTNDGVKIFEELKVLYKEDVKNLYIHFQKVCGERIVTEEITLNGTLHLN